MLLADSAILKAIEDGEIVIKPFDRACLGSNSYDVHLSKHLAVYKNFPLDARTPNEIERFEIPNEGIVLNPGRLYLGSTLEYTESHNHVPFLDGKSSTGRLGINIHITAGRGDVGFCNHWTLELSVVEPVRIYTGMPIGQLIYFAIAGEILNPYDKKVGAKYNAVVSAQPRESLMYKNTF